MSQDAYESNLLEKQTPTGGSSVRRVCHDLVSKLGLLRPSSDKTHGKRSQEDKEASNDTSFAPKVLPALIAEEVLGHELHERGERQQTRRNGVHDADDNKTDLGIGAVKCVCCNSKSLTERRSEAVGHSHEPRLVLPVCGPFDHRDARAKSETFECLMKDNGNEENDELIAHGHTKSHADKDAVEENAELEKDALQSLLSELHLRRHDLDRLKTGSGLLTLAFSSPWLRFFIDGREAVQAVANAGAASAGGLHISHWHVGALFSIGGCFIGIFDGSFVRLVG